MRSGQFTTHEKATNQHPCSPSQSFSPQTLVTPSFLQPSLAPAPAATFTSPLTAPIQVGPLLGSGMFGKVFAGLWYNSTMAAYVKVAIKELISSDPAAIKQYLNEMAISQRISQMSSDYVVKFYTDNFIKQHHLIVMELAPNGTLRDMLDKGYVISPVMRHKFAFDLIQACCFLHNTMNIIHSDIKPDNILIFLDATVNAKLTDFGLSIQMEKDEKFVQGRGGSLSYAPPEAHLHDDRSYESDIFSLAIVLYEMFYKVNPFLKNHSTLAEVQKSIIYDELDLQAIKEKDDAAYKLVIQDGAEKNLKKRLDANDCFAIMSRSPYLSLFHSPWKEKDKDNSEKKSHRKNHCNLH